MALHDLSKSMYLNGYADSGGGAFDPYEELMECAKYLNKLMREEKSRMMLYPDMTRSTYEASDYFVFAAPCTFKEWTELWREIELRWRNRQSSDPNSRAKNDDYLAWLIVKDDSDEQVVIILHDKHDTDTEAEETAAWIRVSEEFTGMIYALKYDPGYGSSSTLAQIVCRTAGVPPSQVRHIIPSRRNNV